MIGGRNRDISRRKALRKKRIADQIYWTSRERGWDYYDNLHQYSKNKIHCSCPLCSSKTKNKGKRGKKNYNPAVNWKPSDRRRLDAVGYVEEEPQDVMNVKILMDEDGNIIGAICDSADCVDLEFVELTGDF